MTLQEPSIKNNTRITVKTKSNSAVVFSCKTRKKLHLTDNWRETSKKHDIFRQVRCSLVEQWARYPACPHTMCRFATVGKPWKHQRPLLPCRPVPLTTLITPVFMSVRVSVGGSLSLAGGISHAAPPPPAVRGSLTAGAYEPRFYRQVAPQASLAFPWAEAVTRALAGPCDPSRPPQEGAVWRLLAGTTRHRKGLFVELKEHL